MISVSLCTASVLSLAEQVDPVVHMQSLEPLQRPDWNIMQPPDAGGGGGGGGVTGEFDPPLAMHAVVRVQREPICEHHLDVWAEDEAALYCPDLT